MGYMAHHAVLVHISAFGSVTKDSLTAELDDFRAGLPAHWRPLVIGPVSTVVNGDFTAAFMPDGSKEGWVDSDDGEVFRERFIKIFGDRYDDGSSQYDVALVRFGGDEPSLASIEDPR